MIVTDNKQNETSHRSVSRDKGIFIVSQQCYGRVLWVLVHLDPTLTNYM